MSRDYIIRLAWPDAPLWQNRRYHRQVVARAKAAQRKEAWALALHHAVERMPEAVIEFTFHPPPRSRPDAQNLPATVKGAIDGIADAMGCDDRGFRCVFPNQVAEKIKGGCVLVHVTPGKDDK